LNTSREEKEMKHQAAGCISLRAVKERYAMVGVWMLGLLAVNTYLLSLKGATSTTSTSTPAPPPLHFDLQDEATTSSASIRATETGLPRPNEILIVTLCTKMKNPIETYPLQNHEEYAALHGYSWMPVFRNVWPDRFPAWHKMKLLMSLMNSNNQNYKWFWVLDYDTLIMNFNLTIEDHVLRAGQQLWYKDQYPDFIIGQDCNFMNTGSFFLQNTAWSRGFVEKVWNYNIAQVKLVEFWWEQAIFIHMWEHEPDYLLGHMLLVPSQWFNSYPRPCGGFRAYEEGDFVLHFPGEWKGLFEEAIAKHRASNVRSVS